MTEGNDAGGRGGACEADCEARCDDGFADDCADILCSDSPSVSLSVLGTELAALSTGLSSWSSPPCPCPLRRWTALGGSSNRSASSSSTVRVRGSSPSIPFVYCRFIGAARALPAPRPDEPFTVAGRRPPLSTPCSRSPCSQVLAPEACARVSCFSTSSASASTASAGRREHLAREGDSPARAAG